MNANAELKKEVKEFLNGLGYNTKQNAMSISVKSVMYDISIRINVKDMSINKFALNKAIYDRFESIRYDHNGSGDILSGGNTYVNVVYDYVKFDEEIEKYVDFAKQAIEKWKLICEDYEGIPIAETEDKKMFMNYGGNGRCSISSKHDLCIMFECGKYYARGVRDVAEALFYFTRFGTFKEERE